jgi:hypothetical protein
VPPQLLPPDFDALLCEAVRAFWSNRVSALSTAQAGARGQVISGGNLNGFLSLARAVLAHIGLPAASVFTNKGRTALPGYFRATKRWDLLVVHEGRLLAALELKSQVGSFGNNQNNRVEEALGVATDLWAASREGLLDPRPPFLGWLMVLEDAPASRCRVSVEEPHHKVSPLFVGASYAERYRLLCERLLSERLYQGAALVLSDSAEGAASGAHRALSAPTSAEAMFAALAAHVLAQLPR